MYCASVSFCLSETNAPCSITSLTASKSRIGNFGFDSPGFFCPEKESEVSTSCSLPTGSPLRLLAEKRARKAWRRGETNKFNIRLSLQFRKQHFAFFINALTANSGTLHRPRNSSMQSNALLNCPCVMFDLNVRSVFSHSSFVFWNSFSGEYKHKYNQSNYSRILTWSRVTVMHFCQGPPTFVLLIIIISDFLGFLSNFLILSRRMDKK